MHANQEAHFYTFGYSQGANEADGAGPASSDEEETGITTPNPFSDSTDAGFYTAACELAVFGGWAELWARV